MASTVRGVNAVQHQPSQPRVVGRFEVEHPGVVELVERGVPGRRLRPAELGVGRLVEVGPTEPPVAQQAVDVGVARDEPLVRLVVPQDRMLVAEAPVDRVRVGDERRIGRVEPEVARGDRGRGLGPGRRVTSRVLTRTTRRRRPRGRCSRSRSTWSPTVALTGRPVRPCRSATVRPRVWTPAVSMSMRSVVESDEPRLGQPRHGDRVVDRRPVPAVALAMVDREEPHQVGEDPSGPGPERLEPGDVRREDERLVGDVQAGHPDRDPRLEDDRRRLRVGPDVELGRGGRVALAERPAHQPDGRDAVAQARRGPQQQRDVRQRPGRHEGHRLVRLPKERARQLQRADPDRADRRLGQVRAVEPGGAMDLDRAPTARGRWDVPPRPRPGRRCGQEGSGPGARCGSSDRAARCRRRW